MISRSHLQRWQVEAESWQEDSGAKPDGSRREEKRGDKPWLLWGGACSGPVNNQLTAILGHGLRHPRVQNLRDNDLWSLATTYGTARKCGHTTLLVPPEISTTEVMWLAGLDGLDLIDAGLSAYRARMDDETADWRIHRGKDHQKKE